MQRVLLFKVNLFCFISFFLLESFQTAPLQNLNTSNHWKLVFNCLVLVVLKTLSPLVIDFCWNPGVIWLLIPIMFLMVGEFIFLAHGLFFYTLYNIECILLYSVWLQEVIISVLLQLRKTEVSKEQCWPKAWIVKCLKFLKSLPNLSCNSFCALISVKSYSAKSYVTSLSISFLFCWRMDRT